MHLLYPFAKRFIAGEDLPAALANIQNLNQDGYLSTVDVLGEDTYHPEQAETAKQEYLRLLKEMSAHDFPLDLSLKLSQMGLNIDWDLCRRNVEEIIQKAGRHSVRFDMEGSDTTQRILDMCVDLHATYKNLGVVLQAYLRRTDGDIDRVIREGISTRLCKGAYGEPPEIAYQDMTQIRAQFFKQAQRLLKEGFLPAIATHDEKLIRQIMDFVKREKIPVKTFYFEMLYGVRRDLQKALLDKGYQMRIYVPYGKSWLPYTLRRLAERKENIFFVIKNLVRETLGLGRLH